MWTRAAVHTCQRLSVNNEWGNDLGAGVTSCGASPVGTSLHPLLCPVSGFQGVAVGRSGVWKSLKFKAKQWKCHLAQPHPFAEKNQGVVFPGHRVSPDPPLEAGPLASVSSVPRDGMARVTLLVGNKCLSSAVGTLQRAGQTWSRPEDACSPRTVRCPSAP